MDAVTGFIFYTIVCASSPNGLTENIRSLIEGGWTPQGGVAYSDFYAKPRGSICQAMVKKKPI